MKRIIISAFLVLLYTLGFAQGATYTISGLISDKRSGESLPGVAVITGKNRGAISNNSGFYTVIVAEGMNTIVYQSMGYKEFVLSFNLKKDTVINVALTQAMMSLDAVVVTAKRTKLISTDNQGRVLVNLQQLKKIPSFLGEQDVLKYLQLLPGVSAPKEGSSGLNIRGGSSDQTLLLLDNVPIYNQAHAFGFVSTFSGSTIGSAKLFKGYNAPMYGGRLSGMVTLQTKDGNKYEHKQSIQIGMTTVSIGLEGPIKEGEGSYLFSARRFIPDLLLRGYYKITQPDSKLLFSFYDITAKASYDLGRNHSLSVSLYTGNDNFNISEITRSTEATKASEIETQTDIGMDWGNSIASVRWSATLGPKLFMNNTAYYSFLKTQDITAMEDYSAENTHTSAVEFRMNELGAKSNFDHKITSKYTLNYGVNFSKQYFNPQIASTNVNDIITETDNGHREQLTLALYLNNGIKFSNFMLNAGLRLAMYDNQEAVVFSLEPRVSLTYNFNTKSSTWMSYTRNSQPLFSYYSFLPVNNWVPFSGKDLPLSDQYSIGGKTSIKKALSITLEAYYKNSTNIPLIYNSDDFLSGEGGGDIVSSRAYGAEFSLQYHQGRFTTMTSYNYSRSEYDINKSWVPFVYDTPHNVNILLTYDVIKRTGKTHTFSLNVSYKTGVPYILSNETYPNFSSIIPAPIRISDSDIAYVPEYSNVRLENYFRTDINYSMEKKKANGTRTWQFSVLNITNHTNPYLIIKIEDKYKSYSIIPLMPSISYRRTF